MREYSDEYMRIYIECENTYRICENIIINFVIDVKLDLEFFYQRRNFFSLKWRLKLVITLQSIKKTIVTVNEKFCQTLPSHAVTATSIV